MGVVDFEENQFGFLAEAGDLSEEAINDGCAFGAAVEGEAGLKVADGLLEFWDSA